MIDTWHRLAKGWIKKMSLEAAKTYHTVHFDELSNIVYPRTYQECVNCLSALSPTIANPANEKVHVFIACALRDSSKLSMKWPVVWHRIAKQAQGEPPSIYIVPRSRPLIDTQDEMWTCKTAIGLRGVAAGCSVIYRCWRRRSYPECHWDYARALFIGPNVPEWNNAMLPKTK